MTLFKPRLVTVHRPTCLFHQQQLAANNAAKHSPVTTPNRLKDKSRRTSSIISLTQRSTSGDDLATSPHVLSRENEIDLYVVFCKSSMFSR